MSAQGSKTNSASDKPQLRLALVITDLDVGGAERALAELALRLDRRRFDIRVYSLAAEHADPVRSLVPKLRAAGLTVECLGARRWRDTARSIARLTAAWRAWQPDVVQTFLFHANLIGRVAAWRAGVPHVVSGIRVAEQRGRWRLWIDRWTDHLVARHVCVSQGVAEFSHTRGGLPVEKIVVVPNGVDCAVYESAAPITAAELGVPSGRRWITYVGRLDAQKGLEWLLAEAPRWLLPLVDHDLLLVGAGPLAAQLQSLAAHRTLAGRVHLVGWRGDVPRILAGSDLLVLPSLWEGMPNVILEAMAAGRPVLANDVEGVRELLGSDAEFQVVPLGDAPRWVSQARRLTADRELADQLGSRNQLRVRQEFSLASTTAAYAAIYESLVRP